MHSVLTNLFDRKSAARLPFRMAACLAVAMLSALAIASAASGSTSQKSVMQDDGQIMAQNDEHRNDALDEIKALGVDVVKIGALWRTYSPDPTSNSKPNVDTTDPSNYSWGALQSAVDGIRARGMEPWIMVSTPGPNWATAQSTASTQEGVYKPSPAEFGKFAEAIAKQFPEVDIWSEGNEPNFQYWLWPQVGKGNVSLSAVHYRKMYVAARDGLRKAPGTSGDQILFGGLAPRAFLPKPGQRATQPVTFLQDFFCLDKTNKPLKGAAAKARECTGKYKKIDATGFAYHPYTVAGGPLVKPTSLDDAPIAYLKRIYRVLDKAAAYKRLSKRKIPLWNAEFGYQSDPPDIFQASISKIPGFLNTAEYLSYKDPRVKTYHQFQLIDDAATVSAPVGSSDRYAGFQSGLRFEDGSRKFGVYTGYQFPLMVFKTTLSSTVKVWGGVRAKQPGVPIEVQAKIGGSFKTLKTINTGGRYFNTVIKTSGAASKNYRLLVGDDESRTTKPVKQVKASSK
jgi:hypothetical protein